MAQALAVHCEVACAALHALPQKPQFAALLVRSVSHATAGLLSHSPRPGLHGESSQLELTHRSMFASQVCAQWPQWLGSALRSASQPFAGEPSQSAYSPAHVIMQLPFLHSAVPCAFWQPPGQLGGPASGAPASGMLLVAASLPASVLASALLLTAASMPASTLLMPASGPLL